MALTRHLVHNGGVHLQLQLAENLPWVSVDQNQMRQVLLRHYCFSQYNRDRLWRGANRSQLRRYPDDWVFTFLDGDGKAFDFGIDISECAILKFYSSQNAENLIPFIFHLDHASGKLLGLGFNRQDTLANGAAVCDCRWKLGAETPGWPPILDTYLLNSYSEMEVS